MGLFHPPGWDNISPDVKFGGYSCLKSEKKRDLTLVYDRRMAVVNAQDHYYVQMYSYRRQQIDI